MAAHRAQTLARHRHQVRRTHRAVQRHQHARPPGSASLPEHGYTMAFRCTAPWESGRSVEIHRLRGVTGTNSSCDPICCRGGKARVLICSPATAMTVMAAASAAVTFALTPGLRRLGPAAGSVPAGGVPAGADAGRGLTTRPNLRPTGTA